MAGPLNPPAGPVTSSFKTLTEVEPRTAINATNTPGDATALFKITKAGSYYLTGNLTGQAGRSGIIITVSDVTIDLNGFEMLGVAGSADGIAVQGTVANIAVVHGVVRSWGASGISLSNGTSFNTRIDDVRAYQNQGSGLAVGVSGIISHCSSTYNAGTGIVAGTTSCIIDCTMTNNSARGIYAEDGCTITRCSVAASGFEGIRASDACTILDCTVRLNAQDGIRVDTKCRVAGNTAEGNGTGNFGGAGIYATGTDNRIEGNNCLGADLGVYVTGTGNFVIKNSCSGNTTNWNVAAGNVCYVVSATTCPAIAGNTGGSALGTSESNANFTY